MHTQMTVSASIATAIAASIQRDGLTANPDIHVGIYQSGDHCESETLTRRWMAQATRVLQTQFAEGLPLHVGVMDSVWVDCLLVAEIDGYKIEKETRVFVFAVQQSPNKYALVMDCSRGVTTEPC